MVKVSAGLYSVGYDALPISVNKHVLVCKTVAMVLSLLGGLLRDALRDLGVVVDGVGEALGGSLGLSDGGGGLVLGLARSVHDVQKVVEEE